MTLYQRKKAHTIPLTHEPQRNAAKATRRRSIPQVSVIALIAVAGVLVAVLQGCQPPPPETYTNSIGMEFVLIPGGTFTMGSEDGYGWEKPAHTMTVEQPFYMGRYEVTQGQWKAVMGTEPWQGAEDVREGDTYPAVYVNGNHAQAFVEKLNALDRENRYLLPTEVEWEYACRAGSAAAYSFGDDVNALGDYAWYRENAEGFAQPVGQKKPNAWGLYDMNGNVWEWMRSLQEVYPYDPKDGREDLDAADEYHPRVFRGGSYFSNSRNVRCAFRDGQSPDGYYSTGGFRLVMLCPRCGS